MRAWKPRRMSPRASRSPERFCAFCHVCYGANQLYNVYFGGPPYQDLVVSLAEACQTVLRIVWGGLLLLGRAAEEPHPLRCISNVRTSSRSSTFLRSPCINSITPHRMWGTRSGSRGSCVELAQAQAPKWTSASYLGSRCGTGTLPSSGHHCAPTCTVASTPTRRSVSPSRLFFHSASQRRTCGPISTWISRSAAHDRPFCSHSMDQPPDVHHQLTEFSC